MKPRALAFITALLITPATNLAAKAASNGPIDFARDVRPILSAACFQCHGPDEKQRKGDLRLDTEDGALGVRDGHAPFVPGNLEASEALRRMRSPDPDERMPPPDSGKALSEAQIDLVKRWVEQGAPWSSHWSFVSPRRPSSPQWGGDAAASWIRNPIDAFVLSRLKRAGLTPSPEADKITLIRRLSLDLVGLPPTIEETDAFAADDRSDAYDRLISALLDTPHYGERWGRLWLDGARYADSDGYEKDKSRQVWAYRDWVIAALNRDLAYDQFIIEQIAGDLLPGATQDQLVATGFLRNSMINEEGGVDPEQFRMEAMFDRMDAIGKSILGLTIQCAQCHNHKYDPLTQADYYRMFAFLNNAHEASIVVYMPEEEKRREDIFHRIRQIEAELKSGRPDWAERMRQWEAAVRGNPPNWVVVEPAVDEISTGGQKYLPLPDGSLLAQGYAPTKHQVKLTARTSEQGITAFRLELLTHDDLPLGGPGRSVQGTGALTEFEVEAAPADDPQKVEKIKFVAASSDVELPEEPLEAIYDDRSGKRRVTGPAAFAIDGKEETAWGINAGSGRRNQPRKAVFVAERPITHPAGTLLTFYLSQKHGGWNSDDNQNCNLGRVRLSLTTATGPAADPLPARVRQIVAAPSEQRTDEQTDAVFAYWRTTVPEWKEQNDAIEALWREHPPGSSQLVLAERGAARETHMLERGDFLKPRDKVEPGVPAFLHPLAAGSSRDRLGFARWLADRNSPTTARSIVNRVWQAYFGVGLVSTSEDLGSQSETSSHPELLDWLAVEFMDHGWSLKWLHRLIVSSSTYRQSSRVTPELLAHDPANRLLARGPRFRVDGEVVRDIALAASGLLNPALGGPSVYPPAPDFLFQPPVSYGPKIWKSETGDNRYRRGVYTFRYRSVPYPVLQTFDAPNGDFACVRRVRSNTPLQALVTLNEPLFVECAQALALKTLELGGASDETRVEYLFRRCLVRRPSDVERGELLDLLARQTKHLAEGWTDAGTIANHDPSRPAVLPPGATPSQLAAWTLLSRVILNLDETITKE
ncbi:MAG TPA: PSD1 and planctomycete cytochrome C domain-containing protein [Pirellulales bacterium]|nr:PSD1 and planctomycete cytochrome C domain-containing protein [Pirellulales bacterium]